MVTATDIFARDEGAIADWLLAAAQGYVGAVARSAQASAGATARAQALALHPIENDDRVSFAGLVLNAAQRRDVDAAEAPLAARFAAARLEAGAVQAVRRWGAEHGVGALGLILEILTERRSVAGLRAAAELLRAGRLRALDETATVGKAGHSFVDLAASVAASEPDARWILENIETDPLLWSETLRPLVCVGQTRAEPSAWLRLLSRDLGSFHALRPLARRANLHALVEAAGLASVAQEAARMVEAVGVDEVVGGGTPASRALAAIFRGPEAPVGYFNGVILCGAARYSIHDPQDPARARSELGKELPVVIGDWFAILTGADWDVVEDYAALEAFMPPPPPLETDVAGGGGLFGHARMHHQWGRS